MNRSEDFRQAVDRRLGSVVLSDEARSRIRRAACEADAANRPGLQITPKPTKKPLRLRRTVLVAVAACLVLVIGVSAAAGMLPGFDWLVNRYGADFQKVAQPVGLFSVQDGLRMDVLAAVNDGDSAVIYLGFTDTTGKNRVDKTTRMMDVSVDDVVFSHARYMDFDAATGQAIFRVQLSPHELDLSGKKLTIRANSLLTGEKELVAYDTGVTLQDIMDANPQPQLAGLSALDSYNMPSQQFGLQYGSNASVAQMLDNEFNTGKLPVLAAAHIPGITLPAGQELLAAGMVNGLLHVQHRPTTQAGNQSRVDYYLGLSGALPYTGNLTSATLWLGTPPASASGREVYEAKETILEIPTGIPAGKLSLLACGTTYADVLPGEWAVTFTLDQSPPELSAECEIDLGGVVITSLQVSTIGTTARGTGDWGPDTQSLEMEVWLKDGTNVESDSMSMGWSEDGIVLRRGFVRPISLSNVDRLVVNGQEIPLASE